MIISNAEQILTLIGPAARDRKTLLWVCKGWDFREGIESQDDSEPFNEALLKYRSEINELDRSVADLFWKAVWFQGGRSPILQALNQKQSNRQLAGRAIIPIASQVDAKLSLSGAEFLPLFVLSGLLDEKVPLASRYGGLGPVSRLRLSWDLASQLEMFPGHVLIVLGAQKESDLDTLLQVCNECALLNLMVVVACKDTLNFQDPVNSGVKVLRWTESTETMIRELASLGQPTASQVPSKSLRIGSQIMAVNDQVLDKVSRYMKVLTLSEITSPTSFGISDLIAFFKNDIDNWSGFGAGTLVPRDSVDAASESYREIVLQHLEKLRDSRATTSSFYINLPADEGSGATTVLRSIAFEAARRGYPSLFMRPECPAVDAEVLKAFATDLNELAQQSGISHFPPLLLIFDTEQGKDLNVANLLQSLVASGRNVVALHAIRRSTVSGQAKPQIHGRKLELQPLLATASDADVDRCLQTFENLFRTWGLPLGVPSKAQWRSYERASSWHSIDDAEQVPSLFWVALRFFLVEQADFRTSESILNALGDWIEKRTETIEDERLKQVTFYVALLSSFRIPCPLWTALRPVFGERFPSELSITVGNLDAVLEWMPANETIGDQLLRFRHPAFALEYLRRNRVLESGSRLSALRPLLESMSPGSAGDFWIAEKLASSVLAPKFAETSSIDLKQRLDIFDCIPEAISFRSKIILHHWARCLYRCAEDRNTPDLSDSDRFGLLTESIDKIEMALRLPQSPGRDENPSHLHNTAGTAYARLALFFDQRAQSTDSKSAWESAGSHFRHSLLLSGNTNVEAMIAFATRLLDHACPYNEEGKDLTDDDLNDVASALGLLKEAREVYENHPDPDDTWMDQILQQETRAKRLLSPESIDAQIAALKQTDRAELAYFISATWVYSSSPYPDQVDRAIEVLEEFGGTNRRPSERILLLWLSLLHTRASRTKSYDFKAERELRLQLEQCEDFSRRPIDLFRHAVLCYQIGEYLEGAGRFRQLREHMQMSEYPQLNVRDIWRDANDPGKARLTTVRLTRFVTDWRAEGYVQELQQNVKLSPRHFAPPLRVNAVAQCVIRFSAFGPLAVPPRMEQSL